MRSLIVTLIVFFVVVPQWAQAQFKDVCALSQMPLPNDLKLTGLEKSNYQMRLKNECSLQTRYVALEKEMRTYYGLTLENISVYQALRYVQRAFYDKARKENVPLEILYQRNKADYDLPLDQRSTEIWDNWMIGLRQFPNFVDRIRRTGRIDLQDITTAHKGFFSLSTEVGDFSNPLTPGQLKGPNDGTVMWYKISPDARVRSFQVLIDKINTRYGELQLLPPADPREASMNLPIRVRQLASDNGYYFYSAASEMVDAHMKNLLRFLNSQLGYAARGQHMIWNGKPMTPGETAFLAQQFFVHVHPFRDGNGRTSRFLQEALLTLFQLPFGSSGDLMTEDMTTYQSDYYQYAMLKTSVQLEAVKSCVIKVYPQVFYRVGNLQNADPQSMPYDCRLVYDQSPR